MIYPSSPQILRDRDKRFRWYLDEDVTIYLPDNSILLLSKGYRFDGHSVPLIFRPLFRRYTNEDITCAMIHDILVDFESMHRYNRAYIDNVYTKCMSCRATPWRAYFMTRAVWLYGFLRFTLWGDYRGEPKPNTKITVRIDVV